MWPECVNDHRGDWGLGRRDGKQQKHCELYSGDVWEYVVGFKIGNEEAKLVF